MAFCLTLLVAQLTGGGFNVWGDVGCENPDLQVFAPSSVAYAVARPAFAAAQQTPVRVWPGQSRVALAVESVASVGRVTLLAVGAFTHSYDQNQRLVDLAIVATDAATQTVYVDVPASPVCFPGQYRAFLVSGTGVHAVSSLALHVEVVAAPATLAQQDDPFGALVEDDDDLGATVDELYSAFQ